MDDVALGRLLIDRGLVHRDAVGAAYRSKAPGRSLADELVARRLIAPQVLRSLLQATPPPSLSRSAEQVFLPQPPAQPLTDVAPPGVEHATMMAPPGAEHATMMAPPGAANETRAGGPPAPGGSRPPPGGGALTEGELVDGRYRIGRLLGKGGMGAVYLADDARTGGQVAIKVLLRDASQELLQRFEREAQLAARVDHAGGIVRVHAYGMHRGLPYCALEFVEGSDLGKALEGGPLEPMRLARIVEKTALALHACHEAGLVHRDVKPGNVLLRAADDEPRLADFGLAKAADLERMTRTGAVLGTPAYMAPEQADDARVGVDARADVYALGAILYHGLAGRAPFGGGALHEVLVKLLKDDPKPPHEINPAAPRDLEAVARKALEKKADDRYPTARALAEELARFQRGEPVLARPLGRVARFRRRLERRDQRAIASVVGTVLALAVSLVAAGLVVQRLSRTSAGDHAAWAEEVLDPWRLGLGDGPAPADAEVAARLEHLLALRAEGAEGVDPMIERLRRVQLRLADLRRDPDAPSLRGQDSGFARPRRMAGAEEHITDAVLHAERDPRRALQELDLVAAGDWPSWAEPARVEAWANELATPELERLDQFERYLATLGEDGLASARDALLRGLLRGWESASSRTDLGPAPLRELLERLAALCARLDGGTALAAAKPAALERVATSWVTTICARPTCEQQIEALRLLEAVVRSEPPVALPAAVTSALDALTARRAAAIAASGAPSQLILESLQFEEAASQVDAARRPHPELAAAIQDAVELQRLERTGTRAWELTLGALRLGLDLTRHLRSFALQGDQVLPALATARPGSRALRFIEFDEYRANTRDSSERDERADRADRDEVLRREALRREALRREGELGERVLEDGLVEDLAPRLKLEACVRAGAAIWDEGTYTQEPPSRASIDRLARLGRLACRLADELTAAPPPNQTPKALADLVHHAGAIAALGCTYSEPVIRAAAWDEALRRVVAVQGLTEEECARLQDDVRRSRVLQAWELRWWDELIATGRDYLRHTQALRDREAYRMRGYVLEGYLAGRDDEAGGRAFLEEERARVPNLLELRTNDEELQDLVDKLRRRAAGIGVR